MKRQLIVAAASVIFAMSAFGSTQVAQSSVASSAWLLADNQANATSSDQAATDQNNAATPSDQATSSNGAQSQNNDQENTDTN